MMPVSIHRLTSVSADQAQALAGLTRDVVHAGASIGFMAPLSTGRALAFWHSVAEGVHAGDRALLVARTGAGTTVGTVQLVLGLPENQPHRADVAKMMVHPSARRQGIAARLLRAVEDLALVCGRSLLVLDTVTGGDAERLYLQGGWQPCGTIPDYALLPQGGLAATTVLYRRLSAGSPQADRKLTGS